MKTPKRPRSFLRKAACACMLAAAIQPAAFAESTSFTYQGELIQSGVPVNQAMDFIFDLYTLETGGTLLATVTVAGVSVVDGRFTATLDGLAAHFTSSADRWIEIRVKKPTAGIYTILSPRQPLTSAPFAFFSRHSNTANSVTGTIPSSQITGTFSPNVLSTGTINSTLNFASPFTTSSSAKITNLNTDMLDGLDSSAFVKKAGDTMNGNLGIPSSTLDFGTTTRQMIDLWGASQYGIGVQSGTLYNRTNLRYSWFSGGAHSNAENDPGAGGQRLMTLTHSLLELRPAVANDTAGQGPIAIGFGDSNATGRPYVSVGEADADDEMELIAKRINIKTNNTNGFGGLHFGTFVGQSITLFENATDSYGMGIQGGTEYFRTGSQFAWYRDGTHSSTAGDPGTGGAVLATLSANGDLQLGGNLSTTVLTIRGGADMAEPFEMTPSDELEPGCVVVIDNANPGKLKLSHTVFDTRVAGIISGAGGVQPGLRLHQEGVLEGDHHVALSGRVYVKADASNGPIRPGDLLTTSAMPGHAMKVSDHGRAQGAILGKAMSTLEEGKGLVLVLVSLQ